MGERETLIYYSTHLCIYWLILFKYIFKRFYLFLDRGEGKEKERERSINVCLPLTHPLLGIWPATQACALMGNWTGDPLVHRPALNQLSHTSRDIGDSCVLLDQGSDPQLRCMMAMSNLLSYHARAQNLTFFWVGYTVCLVFSIK